MALRGKKAEAVEKRLKCLFYGVAGSGKTTAAISFPAPYVIDTERGSENSQYLELIKKNGGALFQTSDFNELITEVKALLTEKHEYKTLVIDPLTTIYNDLLEHAAAKPTKDGSDPTAFGRHYNDANKQIKRLLSLLLRLDMNVIITSHAKNEYGNNMSVLGVTYDCYKKLDYLFDLVIEIKKIGLKRIGCARKTRIATFEEGNDFEFSYETIAQKYGKDILEKAAVNEKLAEPGQIKEFQRLVKLLKISDDQVDKALAKANCASVYDMSYERIEEAILNLQHKLEGKTE